MADISTRAPADPPSGPRAGQPSQPQCAPQSERRFGRFGRFEGRSRWRGSGRRRIRLTAGVAGGPGRGDPLFRNAYALMLNTGVSAVLGLGYWLVAARYYPEDAVGRGSAAIAAMKFLAGITAVTLTGALARFIPVAGRRTGTLVLRTYLASSAVVAVAAAAFLLTLDLWGPSYRFLHGLLPGLGFVGAVVAWSVLTLQDGVLTGLRSAVWVPVGNTVFSTGKLALLVLLAATIPASGVFVSWVAAIALSVVPLGWLVFRRLIPRHVRSTAPVVALPSARQIGRFLAGDCTGSLFALAVVYLVPVIVAARISAQNNAYFYITSTIGSTVDLLAINMGASLTVEGAHDPSRLAGNCRAALRRMTRIMIPICMFLLVFAPNILSVFGPGYAANGAPLLRFMALASLTRVVLEVYFGALRARSHTSRLALLQGALCVLILSSTLALLPPLGIMGAGVAEFGSQCVIAAVACYGLVRILRPGPAPASVTAVAVPPAPDMDHDTLVLGTRWAPQSSALDQDTLPLGVRLDFDHPERRPYVPPVADEAHETPQRRPAPGAPAAREAPETREPHAAPTTRQHREAPQVPPGPWTGPHPGVRPQPLAGPGPGVRLPLRARLPEFGGWLVLAAALALYWLPLRGMDDASLDRMNGLGLVSVLPGPTLVGAALLVSAFCWALWLRRPRRLLLLAVLLATVVSLHSVPTLLESQPRFPTAWQHAGFIEYIDRTGSAVPYLDARFSWPGFFAGVAFVTKACGITDLTEVLRWWPLAMQLLYLAPLMLLLSAVRAQWRAKWCAAWLFVLGGWVGQDYFSPQSLNYFFYLAFVAVLLVWFRSPRQAGGGLRPGEAEVRPAGRGERAMLLALLLGLFTASVVSHQLTPFVMLGVATALVVWRRSTLRGLPLLCGVLVAAWVGFLAEPYWSGHLNDLFGGMGSLGGNVTSSVSGRIEGGSPTHKLVLYTRVLLAAAMMAAAALGWLRRRLAGTSDRVLLILLLVPFLGLGLQSYGGEMALRVFLFALPGASVLAALAFFPQLPGSAVPPQPAARAGSANSAHPSGPPHPAGPARAVGGDRPAAVRLPAAPLAMLLAGLVLIGGFLVARWGNEPFERVRTGEVAALDYVYLHDAPSARLLWPSRDPVDDVTPSMPWMALDMDKVSYVPVAAPRDPSQVDGLVQALRDSGPNSYLMVNRGVATYLQLDAGYPGAWRSRLLTALDRSGELRKVVSDPDAAVYQLAVPLPGPVPQPVVGRVGPVVTWTPWTVAGAVAAGLLLMLLGARELARILVPAKRRQRWMRLSLTVAMPLLAVFLASLVDRFLTLS